MISGQMKFRRIGKEMKLVEKLDLCNYDILPLDFNQFAFGKNEIAVSLDGYSYPLVRKEIQKKPIIQIIDIREIKAHLRKLRKQWFPIGDKNTTMMVGVFWTAFMQYIFPWCLDIAKVYVAWKIVQGFYSEGKGVAEGGKGGKGGFGALIHYGKWYIALSLIPWGVTLIDEVAHQMGVQLMKAPINLPTSK